MNLFSRKRACGSLRLAAPVLFGAMLSLQGCALLKGNSGDNAVSAQTPSAAAPQAGNSALQATGSALPPAATPPSTPAPAVEPQPEPAPVGNGLTLSAGNYQCELNRVVRIRSLSQDGQTMVMGWAGKDHTLTAVRARSGALRFEDPQSGLVWITIVGKSLLVDFRNGQQLANECKLATGPLSEDPKGEESVDPKPAAKPHKRYSPKKTRTQG